MKTIKNSQLTYSKRSKSFFYHPLRLILLILLTLSVSGCDIKDGSFFGPYGDDFEEGDAPPSLQDIRGPFAIQYTLIEDTCDIGAPSDTRTADIEINESLGRLSVFFNDNIGRDVHGPYDLMSGNFLGISDPADIAGGYTATENWDVDFYYGETLPTGYDISLTPFGGLSLVEVRDPSEEPFCEISYEVWGYKTGN